MRNLKKALWGENMKRRMNVFNNIPVYRYYSDDEIDVIDKFVMYPAYPYNRAYPKFVSLNYDKHFNLLGNCLLNTQVGVLEKNTEEPYYSDYRLKAFFRQETALHKSQISPGGQTVLRAAKPYLIFSADFLEWRVFLRCLCSNFQKLRWM